MSIEMNRRTFAKVAVATGVAAGAMGSVAAASAEEAVAEENATITPDEVVTCDFVIIGGGMSGMSACFEATDCGLDTVIVEQ